MHFCINFPPLNHAKSRGSGSKKLYYILQNIQLLSFGTTPACSAPDDIPTVSVSLESEVFLTMPILQINKIVHF